MFLCCPFNGKSVTLPSEVLFVNIFLILILFCDLFFIFTFTLLSFFCFFGLFLIAFSPVFSKKFFFFALKIIDIISTVHRGRWLRRYRHAVCGRKRRVFRIWISIHNDLVRKRQWFDCLNHIPIQQRLNVVDHSNSRHLDDTQKHIRLREKTDKKEDSQKSEFKNTHHLSITSLNICFVFRPIDPSLRV